MTATMRLGVQVPPADPFWVQMREGIVQQAQLMDLDIVPIDLDAAPHYSPEQAIAALELIQAQELDALISHLFPTALLQRLLHVGLPVIYLNEHPLRHPRFVTTVGLYESAQIGARFLADQIGRRGRVLLVGELASGRSRLDGASEVLRESPQIKALRLQSPWNDEQARASLPAEMRRIGGPLRAIFGFSDGLALAARDVGRSLGLIGADAVVVGIDGDPLALAAIADGGMAATVEVSPLELGRQAVQLAHRGAHGLPLPPHCRYQPRLVTPQNIAEVAAKKLIAMAHLPSRLVGVNRHQERQQLAQLEASQAINRQVTAILDRAALSQAIVDLIRAHYGYDQVYLLRCSDDGAALTYERPPAGQPHASIGRGAPGLLGEAIRRNEVIFVPDVQRSHRFAPDPAWPATVSRVVVPIHVGARLTGMLDLHSAASRLHTRQDLIGLQSLADQLGIALRNAELYEDALQARAAAERADTLKTRLLANVSHELRTPLNVILGYTQLIQGQPQHYAAALPPALLSDVRRVEQSGEHLIRLINDLLDLSRAEIGALDLFPELVDPRALLVEAFESMALRRPAAGPVRWSLDLPAQLPLLEVDPLRVRQVVLNLLSNAEKFTQAGQITLGARVEPPCLHFWVADTGSGIAAELHERIFEPFVTTHQHGGPQAGIGLGLSIVRQLVALHGGTTRLESEPGRGSTFHIQLPLPRLRAPAGAPRPPAMLLVAAPDDELLAGICRSQNVRPYLVAAGEPVERLFASVQPVALVCNVDQASPQDWALIEQIRAHAQGRNLPYLLYSPRDVSAAGGAWLTRVLVKPLRSSQLLELVSDISPAEGAVLIVDDDPESCAFYQQLVATALPGAAVRVAHGGAAALALLAHELPRLLILDLVMPGVDGFAVLQRLRADERTRRVPVLVLSGKVLSAEDVQRLSYSQVIYQSKELLSDDELAAQLRRAYEGAPGPAPQTSGLARRAVAYMQAHHQQRLSRQEIADSLGVSQNYLSEIFQQELGLTPWDYLNRYRIAQARAMLRQGGRSVTEIAGSVGFSDPSYFGRVFRRIVGCTPQQYRVGE